VTWIAYGLRGGILTTRYPAQADDMPPAYRGAVDALPADVESRQRGAAACLSGAISQGGAAVVVDALRCFQCGECARREPSAFRMTNRFELAEVSGDPETIRTMLRRRARMFGRSVHLLHVDAGSDGSEEQELQAIFNPFYDANRLGIFLTPTPRHADVLVATGVVTKPMVQPLLRAYEGMPEPKIVMALGTSACSGGIFALRDRSVLAGSVDSVIPVDVFVPGAPPSPLTILAGLWVALGHAVGRKRTAE
jgi:Ni,Fe-hydrogenase III small subunit